jgi:SAM-dependent methyltransferase
VGRRNLLRFCLNASWLFKRVAHELSGETFGASYHCSALALSEGVLRQWIPPEGSVIDIGCGTGRWCRVAARYARRVVGIDYNPLSIANASGLTTEKNIDYVTGDVTGLQDADGYDVALLIHVLEHIDDVDSFLLALRRIASTLIVEVPDVEADALNTIRRKLGCPYYSDADHVREYTLPVLRGQLERNGWEVRITEQRGGAILAVATHALQRP